MGQMVSAQCSPGEEKKRPHRTPMAGCPRSPGAKIGVPPTIPKDLILAHECSLEPRNHPHGPNAPARGPRTVREALRFLHRGTWRPCTLRHLVLSFLTEESVRIIPPRPHLSHGSFPRPVPGRCSSGTSPGLRLVSVTTRPFPQRQSLPPGERRRAMARSQNGLGLLDVVIIL